MAERRGAGHEGDRVHFFVTCLVDQFRPEAGEAAVACLEDAGCSVAFDARQTCCGQPALNLGHTDEARAVARRVLAIYSGTDGPVVVPSGSCATTMGKLYPELFRDQPEEDAAKVFASRVVEWSRFLFERGYRPEGSGSGDRRAVALHHACHGLRELGLKDEAAALLSSAGVPLVDLPGATECCGFGGAFSVVMPEMSGKMLDVKLDGVEEAVQSGAAEIASLDGGCLMHMQGGHERRAGCPAGTGVCPRYRHVAEVLADAADLRREVP